MKRDVIVIGGGAAGLMCAIEAGKRGRSVTVIEHSERLGKKILISGGGRCNFTNYNAVPENYLSGNPDFCKSALARYTPADFIALVEKHGIPYHEKKLGQLFCDLSSRQIVELLQKECAAARVEIQLNCRVLSIKSLSPDGSLQRRQSNTTKTTDVSPSPKGPRSAERSSSLGKLTGGGLGKPLGRGEGDRDSKLSQFSGGVRFALETNLVPFECDSLVIATGGLSFTKIGATDFGYRIAKQFGLKLAPTRAGLVPIVFEPADQNAFAELAGISIDVEASCNGARFRENILFTHRGLSGPAILQISNYAAPGQPIIIDLLPGQDALKLLTAQHQTNKELKTVLSQVLPARFVQQWCARVVPSKPMNRYTALELERIARQLHHWQIMPADTEGYAKAEVTLGGIDTSELSSRTMEARRVPGLYFIGEVVDVTGWLGGYNFQWAWASGHAAGKVV
jgi:predicted flavoprotein YhiN